MQRRQFFEVIAVAPVLGVVACGTGKPTAPAPSSTVVALRKFVVPADIAPAITFVPRRK